VGFVGGLRGSSQNGSSYSAVLNEAFNYHKLRLFRVEIQVQDNEVDCCRLLGKLVAQRDTMRYKRCEGGGG